MMTLLKLVSFAINTKKAARENKLLNSSKSYSQNADKPYPIPLKFTSSPLFQKRKESPLYLCDSSKEDTIGNFMTIRAMAR